MLIKIKYEIESPLKDVAIGDTMYLNDRLNFIKNIPILRDMFLNKIVVDGFFNEQKFVCIPVWNSNLWGKEFSSIGSFTVLNKLNGKEYLINNLLPANGYTFEPKIIREISSVVVDGEKQIQRTIHNPERGLVFTKEYGAFLRDRFSFNIRWNAHWEPAVVVVDGGYINIQNF